MAKWEEYQKTQWVNNQTPVNESNMNKIEEGIEDNRNNTLDLKTIAEAFITAFRDKLSLSFNTYTHILTFRAGDGETEETINAQASAQIFTNEAEVEELYNFLYQVSYVYPIYWNMLRYCSEQSKLHNVKLIEEGSIIPVEGYTVYDHIPLSVYKEASFSVNTLYIHTIGQLATPVYSIGFYNDSNVIESVVLVGNDNTVNIPSWAKAIAVCFFEAEEQNVIVAPTDLSFENYNTYKLKNSLTAGRGIMINGDTINAKLFYREKN